MGFFNRINALYHKPDIIYPLKPGQSAIFFSDTHMGDGGASDDFAPNRNLFKITLLYYIEKGFLIVLVGDCTENWQSRQKDIEAEYPDILALLNIKKGDVLRLGGNHDRELEYPESLLLKFGSKEFLILHGHQGMDYINDKLWFVGKFFTRWIWRPLEYLGIRDWTSASKNLKRHDYVRKLHLQWASEHPSTLLGCGHLHGLENVGNYWNFGSATVKGQVDCVELEADELRLVKWTAEGRQAV